MYLPPCTFSFHHNGPYALDFLWRNKNFDLELQPLRSDDQITMTENLDAYEDPVAEKTRKGSREYLHMEKI